eukprot:scaffold71103_cov67-Phaeocystis_antarctica.AAC.1
MPPSGGQRRTYGPPATSGPCGGTGRRSTACGSRPLRRGHGSAWWVLGLGLGLGANPNPSPIPNPKPDLHGRCVHEDVELGVRLVGVLKEVVARDHEPAIARAERVEHRLSLASHPQPLLTDEHVEVLLGHDLVLARASRLEQPRERRAKLGSEARLRRVVNALARSRLEHDLAQVRLEVCADGERARDRGVREVGPHDLRLRQLAHEREWLEPVQVADEGTLQHGLQLSEVEGLLYLMQRAQPL